jgi:hypothetical protein
MEKRKKQSTLFTKKFLEELRQTCGSDTMLDHYINDQGMTFHDAIIRLSNFHDIKPEYIQRQKAE